MIRSSVNLDPGVSAVNPASSNSFAQRSQLLGNSRSGAGSRNVEALQHETAAASRDLCFLQSDVRSLYISHDKRSMSGS
jgi:hypothetical protein